MELSKSISDPSGAPLYEAWRKSARDVGNRDSSSAIVNVKEAPKKNAGAKPALTAKKAVSDEDLVDVRIGSGSDHTVFLNHLGVPTVGLAFDGPYGVYHSMYDDHFWVSRFADPGFKYHTVISQYWGVMGLRLANAEILPFDFQFFGYQLRKWVDEVAKKPGAQQHLDFGPLFATIKGFERQAVAAKVIVRDQNITNFGLQPKANPHKELNDGFRAFEQGWLTPAGIPKRPWFKHQLYAARFTYAHLELPGLTEAVEAQDWTGAKEQLNLLRETVAKQAETLRKLCACEI